MFIVLKSGSEGFACAVFEQLQTRLNNCGCTFVQEAQLTGQQTEHADVIMLGEANQLSKQRRYRWERVGQSLFTITVRKGSQQTLNVLNDLLQNQPGTLHERAHHAEQNQIEKENIISYAKGLALHISRLIITDRYKDLKIIDKKSHKHDKRTKKPRSGTHRDASHAL